MLRIRGFVLVLLAAVAVAGRAETRISLPSSAVQRYGPLSVIGREASWYEDVAVPMVCAATSDIHWVLIGSVYGLEVWDIEARTQAALINDLGMSIVAIAVSPMDDSFAYTDGRTVQIVSIPELTRLAKLEYSGSYPLTSIAFDHQGRMLAGGSFDGTVTLWNIEQEWPVHKLVGRGQPIYGLALTELSAIEDADDTQLVVASGPLGTDLWNLATGSVAPGRALEGAEMDSTDKYPLRLKEFKGYEGTFVIDGWPRLLDSYGWPQRLSSLHEAAVPADDDDQSIRILDWEAKLAPTGDIVAVVASFSQENTSGHPITNWQTTFWNNLSGQKLAEVDRNVRFVFFSRDASRAVLVTRSDILLWDLEELQPLWSPPLAPERFVQTGIYSREDGFVAAMRSSSQSLATVRAIDGDVELLSIEESESEFQVPVAFSRSGDFLAVDSLCGRMSIYSLADAETERSFIVRDVCNVLWNYPWPVDFGETAMATVASGFGNSNALLIHFLEQEFSSIELRLFIPATRIAINADGTRAVVAEGKTIRVLDTASSAILTTLGEHAGAISALALTGDETFLLAGGGDGRAALWNLTGEFSLEWIALHNSAVTAASFGVGARIAATGTQEGKVVLWDVRTGQRLREFHGHLDPVKEIHFSPYDGQLISLDQSGMLLVWDAADVYSPGNTVEIGGLTLNLVQSLSLPSEGGATLPRIALFVRATGGTEWTLWSTAIVDSGATASLFPAALGESLGFDVQEGKKYRLIGATGMAEGWEHGVELGFAHLHATESGADGYMLARNGIPYTLEANAIFSYSASEVLLGGTALMYGLDLASQGGRLVVTVPKETVLGN